MSRWSVWFLFAGVRRVLCRVLVLDTSFGLPWVCGWLLFVLFDDFLCECEVCFRACCVGVVEDGWHAVAWCFAEFDVALDDGFEDEFAEVAFYFFVDLVGQSESAVVHGEQEAFYFEAWVHACFDDFDGVEQFADAFEGEVFALHGDDDAIGCGEGIDGDEAKAGAAVDEDIVVILCDGAEYVFHDALLVLEVEQFYFCADEVDVRRYDVESFDVCGVDDVADVNLSEQCVVDGVFYFADVYAHAAGGVGLRVGVYEEYFLFECGE